MRPCVLCAPTQGRVYGKRGPHTQCRVPLLPLAAVARSDWRLGAAVDKTLSFEQLQGWSDTLAKGEMPVITVLGNREKVDLKALANIGEVIELKPEQLVSW